MKPLRTWMKQFHLLMSIYQDLERSRRYAKNIIDSLINENKKLQEKVNKLEEKVGNLKVSLESTNQ